ncbi:fumarylacetoacetate hydrolase family protein [Paenibacillus protaetiae]|uniref:FAA hydrolase family protein n=1 Tax=Paenibacillus protaetiae TaxID=2509456 RepID=A0A4P6F210_9BACL|nr:fumarylacetoacetate hydrolase family protein [Paenibacillus protaetiae]QAY67107.1 FAA hydrolase family protein [Paenibacillus protaetiae]
MTTDIRNIYCIGRNYRLHALELGNDVPDSPMVFMKPSHAVVPMNGQTVELPAERGEIHFELEIVLRVGKSYEPGMDADACVDAMALGLDLTLRDVQSKLKAKGHPWLDAKGFKNSAPLGEWLAYPGWKALQDSEFTLVRSGVEAQRGSSKDMLFHIPQLIEHIAANFGLKEGDLIFTGTPAGVAALQDGDTLEVYWAERNAGSCTVRLV